MNQEQRLEQQAKTAKMRTKQYTFQEYDKVYRLTAQKFITQGYDYSKFASFIQKNSNMKVPLLATYHNMIYSLSTLIFRSLQNFLILQCQRSDLTRLKPFDLSKLKAPLAQCKKWMSQDQLNTVFKFLIRQLKLRDKKVHISKQQANQLYQCLISTTNKSHEANHVLMNRYNRKGRKCNSNNQQFK